MTWAGFSGTEADLKDWLSALKKWAIALARRRRRPELAEDIESCALDHLVAQGRVGSAMDRALERSVTKALELGDTFSTARDGDLSAGIEDFEGSFIEEFIIDKNTGEDHVAAILDGESAEEGRDHSEVLDELVTTESLLPAKEETALSLKVLRGFTQAETAKYMQVSQSQVSILLKRAGMRAREIQDFNTLMARFRVEPTFGQLEVAWIRI